MANIEYVLVCKNNTASYSVVCKMGENVIAQIDDICDDKKKSEEFCQLLNENKISPVHFFDVFEDYF